MDLAAVQVACDARVESLAAAFSARKRATQTTTTETPSPLPFCHDVSLHINRCARRLPPFTRDHTPPTAPTDRSPPPTHRIGASPPRLNALNRTGISPTSARTDRPEGPSARETSAAPRRSGWPQARLASSSATASGAERNPVLGVC